MSTDTKDVLKMSAKGLSRKKRKQLNELKRVSLIDGWLQELINLRKTGKTNARAGITLDRRIHKLMRENPQDRALIRSAYLELGRMLSKQVNQLIAKMQSDER